jgi:hypothetical protein
MDGELSKLSARYTVDDVWGAFESLRGLMLRFSRSRPRRGMGLSEFLGGVLQLRRGGIGKSLSKIGGSFVDVLRRWWRDDGALARVETVACSSSLLALLKASREGWALGPGVVSKSPSPMLMLQTFLGRKPRWQVRPAFLRRLVARPSFVIGSWSLPRGHSMTRMRFGRSRAWSEWRLLTSPGWELNGRLNSTSSYKRLAITIQDHDVLQR